MEQVTNKEYAKRWRDYEIKEVGGKTYKILKSQIDYEKDMVYSENGDYWLFTVTTSNYSGKIEVCDVWDWDKDEKTGEKQATYLHTEINRRKFRSNNSAMNYLRKLLKDEANK